MTALQALQALRKLLADPKRWTKGVYAKDAKGNTVHAHMPDAACWCLTGGMRKVLVDADPQRRPNLAPILLGMGSTQLDVVKFNDAKTTTHAEVLALLDNAIVRLKKGKRT